MQIELKGIDKNNYEACVELNLDEQQKGFISPNWLSLLEVNYEDGERHPLAIYKDDSVIGFILYVFYPADEDYPLDSWWIERFMIDKDYQKKGYGKAALRRFIDYFKREYGNIEIRLATVPENDVAMRFFENIGFVKTGEVAAGEVVLYMKL